MFLPCIPSLFRTGGLGLVVSSFNITTTILLAKHQQLNWRLDTVLLDASQNGSNHPMGAVESSHRYIYWTPGRPATRAGGYTTQIPTIYSSILRTSH